MRTQCKHLASIWYELGGEEVLYEHAPEERLEFAIVSAESPDSPNLCTMGRRWTLCWRPNYLKWKPKPLELMIISQNAVADEIEIPVTQPVCSRLCCRLCMVCYGGAWKVQKLGAWNV